MYVSVIPPVHRKLRVLGGLDVVEKVMADDCPLTVKSLSKEGVLKGKVYLELPTTLYVLLKLLLIPAMIFSIYWESTIGPFTIALLFVKAYLSTVVRIYQVEERNQNNIRIRSPETITLLRVL